MSGLAGVVSLQGPLDTAAAVSQVETMGQVQRHRASAGWRVVAHPGLVHVVATVESPGAGDSAADAAVEGTAGGLFLAFDGKITNGAEVREELRRAGTELRSGADRELVLRSWELWGEQSLEHLNGRFAFVLHHSARGISYLVRDRFGHKPFYYASRGDRVYFASEIKTILAVLSPPELNELALLEWSLYGDLLPPRTLFRGIRSLPVGHLLEVGAGARVGDARAYYDLAKVVDPALYAKNAARSTPEIMNILESTIDRAVHGHIDGQRGGVGVLLSGGVDSTVIAAMAARHGEIKSYNFSASTDPLLDERPMAVRVAQKLGLPFQSISLDGDGYRRELARATYLYEMPLWHMQGVPTHLLARRAYQDGIRILLSGVSVGPLLGAASDRYRWIVPPPVLDRVPDGVFRVARKALYAKDGLPVAAPFFTRTLGIGLQLVDGGARFNVVGRCKETYDFLRDRSERRVHVMRMSDNALFLPRFFHQGDSLCMGESVEYCDASVENDFMSLALNLRTDLIFHKKIPKWILKELATRYVPREVAFQKKRPVWNVPVEEYFAPLFKPSLFHDGFLASFLAMDWKSAKDLHAREKDKTQLLYRLVNIETWGRLFFMGQSVEDVTSLLSS